MRKDHSDTEYSTRHETSCAQLFSLRSLEYAFLYTAAQVRDASQLQNNNVSAVRTTVCHLTTAQAGPGSPGIVFPAWQMWRLPGRKTPGSPYPTVPQIVPFAL